MKRRRALGTVKGAEAGRVSATSATPRTERGRRSRKRIIEAAAGLVHLKGVAGTSIDEVLRESGAGKSQFYHYFRDKEALVHAVLEHRMEEWLADFMPSLRELDRWEGIRHWFDIIIQVQEDSGFRGGCPVGSLAAERSEGEEGFRLRLVEALRIKGEFLRKGLETMKDRGELAPDSDPARLAQFVTAVLQGALLIASVEKDRAPLEESLEEAYRHLRASAIDP